MSVWWCLALLWAFRRVAARLLESTAQKICRPKAARSLDVGQKVAGVPESLPLAANACRTLQGRPVYSHSGYSGHFHKAIYILVPERARAVFAVRDQLTISYNLIQLGPPPMNRSLRSRSHFKGSPWMGLDGWMRTRRAPGAPRQFFEHEARGIHPLPCHSISGSVGFPKLNMTRRANTFD